MVDIENIMDRFPNYEIGFMICENTMAPKLEITCPDGYHVYITLNMIDIQENGYEQVAKWIYNYNIGLRRKKLNRII